MYRIAICEDDGKYIEYLRKIIVQADIVSEKEIVFLEFCSGEQMLFQEDWNYDLVIMDMQMNKFSGYETAMKLKEHNGYSLLVFCSGAVLPSDESFKAAPYRYLLKSYTDVKMTEEMQEVLQEMVRKKKRPYIMCKYTSGKEQVRVPAEDILYISKRYEGCQVYSCGKTKAMYPEGLLRVKMGLGEVASTFNEKQGFVRAHNSYIINMEHIIRTQTNYVQLEDDTQLSISRSRTKEFQMAFAKFMATKYMG